jgi:hypothetical protein
MKMTIVEALQDKSTGLRINNYHRWLCWDTKGYWVVYERPYKAKRTTIVIETTDEEEAIKELLKE